jgi:pimeloyl-ACP methyl ester carboxylesterase
MRVSRTMLAALLVCVLCLSCQSDHPPRAAQTPQVQYKSVRVDDLSIFYRETGPVNAPTILLLHGFPSSSTMFEPLFARLGNRYHLIAPDYPGFGHSDAPDPAKFSYTFDHLATVVEHFLAAVGVSQYHMYVQDYGGPVGLRVAVADPKGLQSLIIQNATAHEDGLGPLWDARRAFWADRAANEPALRANFLSFEATRQRHLGTDPANDRYNPDTWTAEFAFLSQPQQAAIQTDLFYDYRTNVASYPAWQAWLREHQPKTLVVWGKYDPSFQVAEAAAYQRDLPQAQVHILDAGHFALDTAADQIAALINDFLSGTKPQ